MFLSFLLPTIAGLSTIIGYLFIYKKETSKTLISSLAFASGVMLSLSIFELIPEAIKLLSQIYKPFPKYLILIIGLNIGIIISIILDKKIKTGSKDNLYKIGIITMIAIIIHNIPEGIVTYIATKFNLKTGLHLSLAIALHNIPEGISIAIPIYYSTKNKKKALLYTVISALSEPLGAVGAHMLLKNIITPNIIALLYTITSGIMIYISVFELLEESIKYNNKKSTIKYFILGIIIMYLSIICS